MNRLCPLVASHQIVNEMKLVMTNNLKLECLGAIQVAALVGLTPLHALTTPKVITFTHKQHVF